MRKELENLKDLKDNWDSYGACPISEKAIENAEKILNLLAHDPIIIPTPSGTVQLEWGDELEMDIGEETISGLFVNSTCSDSSEYIINHG